jgi:anaerobic selenocysteine-containing dehydrogenase
MINDKEHIKPGEDVWVPTVCAGCYNCCGIRVHRVDGKVVEVLGDPKSINSSGYVCAKGLSRTLDVHHPARVTKPLKRTNPEKGLGVDPGWEEISWDEALDMVVAELEKVRADDPRKLIISHFDIVGYKLSTAFAQAFGTNNFHWNRADYCGSASHPAWLITNGTLNSEVDFEKCQYVVLWGTQLGHIINTITLMAGPTLAESRRQGAKLVVVDPFCSNAAAKADVWIPIRPGTDGALALGMLKALVVEEGVIDADFLKHQTNGCYLVKDDGRYWRRERDDKPQVYDLADQRFKAFDDPGLRDPAIEGQFDAGDLAVKPSFQVLKDHLAQIDMDEMSRITTIPVETIREFAHDFGQAARIGETIEVEGMTLPYRPAGIDYKRGMAAHRGGFNSCFAIHMLNLMVGAVDVPGGQRGVNPKGPYWSAEMSEDGLLIPSDIITKYNKPYPGRKASVPKTLDLQELFPTALFTRGFYPWGIDEPETFGIPYKPDVLIHGRTNLMMNSHRAEDMAETLKKLKFQVSISMFIDETAEFADVVLPDAHDFERWDMFPANDPYAFIAPGPGSWYWHLRQPVVQPPPDVRPWNETYLELAERLGIREKMLEIGNNIWILDEKYKVDPSQTYTIRDIAERQAKTVIGDRFNWDMVAETSCMVTREKHVDEAYPRAFFKPRVPVYLEYLLDHADDVRRVLDELNLDWSLESYSPVPVWIPCESLDPDDEYELIASNCKTPLHQFSVTTENLWIDEIARKNPYMYNVMIHTSAAEKRGLATGDTVKVTSKYGSYTGTLKVTELIHPEVVGSCGTFGHWAKGLPISRGKGVLHNQLLPRPDVNRIDVISGQIDQCVRVKIEKVEDQ